ncbi:hypothetical protein C095_11005 [Fusobacterium necrophorum subsp. funduliforme B35]|uniref:Uncharacterized protein n=1 Tax=Fusobacterium necrophorum subsp. funduliforme B35 TaxID=1226633 RepID=A0A0B4ETP7_9FUSO|nr:hypothetical protein C095_11005 [Fusobacterium necrophorum subsp. funduliforme B35]
MNSRQIITLVIIILYMLITILIGLIASKRKTEKNKVMMIF